MWIQLITALSIIFPFAIFAIVLILHSAGFDPDTKDVPKHLKALKKLAWSLAGLCIYYNSGEIREPVRSHMRNVILILTCILITGLWYISELPRWYRPLSEDQRRIWREDPIPEEPQIRDGAERSLVDQVARDSEARREIWKLQQRERFPRRQNEERRPNFTYEERALACGYAAYNYVEGQKDLRRRGVNETLEFREVVLWVDQDERTLRSVSDFTDEALWDPMPDVVGADRLRANQSALFTTCVSVANPAQIRPAIDLILATLERVSYHDKYEGEISRTQFKNSIAVKCALRTTPDDPEGPRNEDNNIVSCMTVCVDKILVVNFHIFHMITSGEDLAGAGAAVQGIGDLFLNLILEPRIIKIWFNYQSDIQAMDATLDEIYRGTPRRTFKTYSREEGWRDRANPPHKLPLNPDQTAAFLGERPQNLTFHKIRGSEWGTECPHGFHRNSVDVFGRPCPCRTSNFDLAVVTEFIIRDLHMENPTAGLQIRPWTEVRSRGNYARFKNCMLLGDKHQELLEILENTGVDRAHPYPIYPTPCPTNCPRGRCQDDCPNFQIQQDHRNAVLRFEGEFFENFSNPIFQETPALLGYAIGDVVGLALVVRFIMTTEKPRLLAERLRLWSFLPADDVFPQAPARFGRPMTGVCGYGGMVDDREQETYFRLIRTVPFAMDHPTLAKSDMIGWEISGDQHIRNALGRDTRWRLIETNNNFYNMVWRFLKTNPMLFGDFLFSYSRKQHGLLRGQFDEHRFSERSTFSKGAIEAIFQQESFYDICLGLLPMLISQLELMLLDELGRDNDNLVRMIRQYDEQRRGYGAPANEMDNRRLLNAKKALGKINEGPAWKPRSIVQLNMYPVTRWIFQPMQKFTTFPDRYELGFRLLVKLIEEFRTLESAGGKRRQRLTSELMGLSGQGEAVRISEAAAAGVRFYADSDSESKWILRDEQRDVRGRIESFIAFWVRLFLNTPIVVTGNNGAGQEFLTYSADGTGMVNGTQPAEKVYDLMFSPTNFYMPEFVNARPTREMATNLPLLPSVEGIISTPFERDDEDVVAPLVAVGDIPLAGARTPREIQFERLFARWSERILGPANTWEAFPA